MIEPRNGYVALFKPFIKEMTKGGIRKNDKMIWDEIWKPSTKFTVCAMDPFNAMGIEPGDKVILDPSQAAQVTEITDSSSGKMIYVIASFAILAIVERANIGKPSKKKFKVDPDFLGVEPESMVESPDGRTTLIMGKEGKA